MVKIVLTNNANVSEKIVDETQSVRGILNDAGFTYGGATLNIEGRAVNQEYLDEPLASFINAGSSVVRITAVAHKSNA